ncbi:MAG: hypothetical protein KDA42_09940 [Planctomycetales bacterium]|nr:hypothetical protein [Planctomycetales bacterium]
MTRIFFTLAIFALVMVVAALTLGLTIPDLYADDVPASTLHWATTHRLTGVAAAISVVFVNSVVVTYFVGTSRWCKEVCETYSLDRQWIVKSAAIKHRTFPWALGGMLLAVAMAAFGAAADPGTGRPTASEWAEYHRFFSILGLGLLAFGFFREWRNISANHRIIDQVMAEVGRIRTEKGLDNQPQKQAVSP